MSTNKVPEAALVAIEKIDAGIAKKLLAPGEHTGRVVLTLAFGIKKGEDYEQRIVAKADPWALLGIALSKLNVVFVAALVHEAEAVNGGQAEALKQIKATADAAIAAIKGATFQKCTGKTTGVCTVEACEVVALNSALVEKADEAEAPAA